jgi:tetratricopeptide (TPR) repeat protein
MKIAALTLLLLLFTAAPGAAQTTVTDPNHREALKHYRMGQELLTSEKFDKAVDEFQAAIELEPLMAMAHYGLGQAHMGLRRYASAVQAFTGCKDAYQRLANQRQANGFAADRNTDDEIRFLRERLIAIRTGQLKGAAGGPAAEARYESKLEELEGMKRNKRFENADTAVPGEVLLALGSAYYRNNQPVEAEREWQAAVAVNPRLGEAYSNLAVRYMMTGRKKEAEEAVKAAEKTKFRVNPQLKADIAKMQ